MITCFAVAQSARADVLADGPDAITGGPFGSAWTDDINPVRNDNTPGGHGDYRIKMNFKFDPALGDTGNPEEEGLPESVRRLAGDFPVGMFMNPNAIPYEKRCPLATFEQQGNPLDPQGAFLGGQPLTYDAYMANPFIPRCPESSRIGTVYIKPSVPISAPGDDPSDSYTTIDGTNGDSPRALPSGSTEAWRQFKRRSELMQNGFPLYLIQTKAEVPAVAGTTVSVFPGQQVATNILTRVEPVTSGPDGDMRLRWVSDVIPRKLTLFAFDGDGMTGVSPFLLRGMEMVIWGKLPATDASGDPLPMIGDSNPETKCHYPNIINPYDPGTEWNPPGNSGIIDPTYPYDGDYDPVSQTGTYAYNPNWLINTRLFWWLGNQYLLPECRTGKTFITNPTDPGPWKSHVYAQAYNSNTNADKDILETGSPNFVTLPDYTQAVDTSKTAPLGTSATATFNDSSRAGYPNLDVTVTNPGYGSTSDAQGVDVPKKIVATLPAAVNVDVARTVDVCEVADFEARKCDDKARVGNVWIKTPLMKDGLTGDAYMVRNTGSSSLPRLGLKIDGAVKFNVLSSTRYVGANFNQIETTFDDIPQIGFESMTMRINGGKGGLLKVNECEAGGAFLNDGGAVSFSITGYSGASTTAAGQTFTADDCFSNSVSIKSPKKCVRGKSFKVTPSLASPAGVSKVSISSTRSKGTTAKSGSFRVTLKIGKKVKKNKKTKFKVKVYFKDQAGKKIPTVTKTGYFKRCK